MLELRRPDRPLLLKTSLVVWLESQETPYHWQCDAYSSSQSIVPSTDSVHSLPFALLNTSASASRSGGQKAGLSFRSNP